MKLDKKYLPLATNLTDAAEAFIEGHNDAETQNYWPIDHFGDHWSSVGSGLSELAKGRQETNDPHTRELLLRILRDLNSKPNLTSLEGVNKTLYTNLRTAAAAMSKLANSPDKGILAALDREEDDIHHKPSRRHAHGTESFTLGYNMLYFACKGGLMDCPKCESKRFSKAGFHKQNQRYKCKDCGCFYTKSSARGYPRQLREAAVSLYVFGLSMNAIARLLGVSHQTSYRWIRAHAEALPRPEIHHSVTEAEIDEMCLYLKKRAHASGYGKCIAANLKSLSPGMWVLAMQPH